VADSLDFTDPERQRRLARAHDLIVDAYRILIDDVGVDNPADNQVLREATICARLGLIWTGDRGGVDAFDPDGQEVEIKTTRLVGSKRVQFPTSRYVSQTVIDRFRSAGWWVFGVFNRYEELVALYRVDAAAMAPIIDALEQRMLARAAANRPLENNPKTALTAFRKDAQRLYLDGRYREREDPRKGWVIELREDG
jgi:Restriction endonuclease PvuII